MSASPDPGADTSRATSLASWLRTRSDRQLGRLLQLRPDLALPAPADLTSLAGRAGVRTSTQRAVDGLAAPALQALESLTLAADDTDAVELDPPADVDPDSPVTTLLDLALVWGDADLLHLSPTVRDAVGPYPGGFGRSAATLFASVPDLQLVAVLRHLGLPPTAQPRAGQAVAQAVTDPDRLAALLADLGDDERDVLERLAAGPPVGSVRNTRLPADDGGPPHRLLARGLLAPLDVQRVELPREVGLAVRHGADPVTADPPDPQVVSRTPDELDRLGTTAVLDVLRLIDALAEAWTVQPPSVLRSGGLGVRELRRTAKALGVDEATTALIAEVAYAAGLVNSTNSTAPVYLPSNEYDVWHGRGAAERWTALTSAWLAMTRQPSLAGQRGDRDRMITVLGPDAERGTIPALRRQVLDVLAQLPPGSAPSDRSDVLELLAWRQPRRATGQRPLAQAILAEADLLGVTAAGGLTGYTRTLLAGSTAAAEHALERALPEPVDHFLVQPDLTVVVPGPPLPSLGAELALLADVESTGGASVYRITERSVRRALDAGRSGRELADFVSARSRTPVPQALQYMIDDAARRHGVLRAGTASAYLRCADDALLSRVLSERVADELGLRLLAPTVLIADAPINRVLEALREAGYAPAAEGPTGELITIEAERPRAPTRNTGRPIVTRGAAGSDAQVADIVRRLRTGDAASERDRRVQAVVAQVPGVSSAGTMELLRTAVREERLVWLGVADPDGGTIAHELHPISLAAGFVRGYEPGHSGLVSYPVHRITAVRLMDEDES